jgi:hypothetical protein
MKIQSLLEIIETRQKPLDKRRSMIILRRLPDVYEWHKETLDLKILGKSRV